MRSWGWGRGRSWLPSSATTRPPTTPAASHRQGTLTPVSRENSSGAPAERRSPAACAGGSGEDAGEGVVQLPGVVEDALRELVDRPVDRREVVLHAVSQPGEHLVAVARGVEEVDRRAPRDAVARRTD